MYAILDIETTGGKYNEEGITEIAIYRFDGHQIVDQFASLINPERPIQPFVANLTGINNEMLRQAPKFYEVAKRIIEITDGCVIVAHNALFDNRILTTEFDRLGYNFEKKTLCTVELSKRLIPDMPSYSLGKLSRSLGIPMTDRHRAQGDAKATVELFKLLLSKDTSKEIISETLKEDTKPKISSKLFDLIETTPSEVGVYYIYNEGGRIIYIGRSKNIRKKLLQHFTNENKKSKRLQMEVQAVSYEKTGNELISILKEYTEIKQNKPKYNRLPRPASTHQAVTTTDENGYIHLKIEKFDKKRKGQLTYSNYQQAKTDLLNFTKKNQLCSKFAGLESGDGSCSFHEMDICYGACVGKENPEHYNARVRSALHEQNFENKNLLLIDRGRVTEERSAIWIENGVYKGYTYFNLNHQINNPEILKAIINPVQQDDELIGIIQDYLRRKKVVKTIDLSANPG